MSECGNARRCEGVFQHRSESAGVLGETALPGFWVVWFESAPTLVGALPVLWFGVRVPRITLSRDTLTRRRVTSKGEVC